jgi:hypothetical protein
MGRELFELAALFVGVAFAALLIGHPGGTATVVDAVGSNFGKLLATVELSGGYSGFAGSAGIGSPYSSAFGG